MTFKYKTTVQERDNMLQWLREGVSYTEISKRLEGKLSKQTYIAALDTYNRYGSSPIIVDDNVLEGCNIIDLYKDYDLPYYDT